MQGSFAYERGKKGQEKKGLRMFCGARERTGQREGIVIFEAGVRGGGQAKAVEPCGKSGTSGNRRSRAVYGVEGRGPRGGALTAVTIFFPWRDPRAGRGRLGKKKNGKLTSRA